MKKLLVLLLIPLLISGCKPNPNRTEITDVDFIRTIGIDKNQEDIMVSVVLKKNDASKKQGSGSGAESDSVAEVLSATAPTFWEAFEKLQEEAPKKMLLGHCEFFIIGESACREDLVKYTDFISRNEDIQLSANVLVCKTGDAKDILDSIKGSSTFLSDSIKSMVEKNSYIGRNNMVDIIRLMGMLDNQYSDIIIPYIAKNEVEQEKFVMDGYAVFQDNRMIDTVNGDLVTGINYLRDNVVMSSNYVAGENNKPVALNVVNSKTKITPKLEEDKLSVYIKVSLNSTIREVHDRDFKIGKTTLDDLAAKENAAVTSTIQQALDFAIQNGIDIFDLNDKVRMAFPVKWRSIRDRWRDIYVSGTYQVEVCSKVKRSYNTDEPSARTN